MIFLELELNNINLDSFNIIDLRDEISFRKKNILNSKNISFYNLLINPEKYLNKDDKYLLICEYGLKSKRVSDILKRLGYHVYSLKGGFRKYNNV